MPIDLMPISPNLEIKTIYRPDIDGLRAIAVLSVMVYHLNSAWLPGGFIGVDVFFVISGFVVAASLATSRTESFTSFLAEFYARRLARISPALVTVLTLSALAAALFIPNAWLSQLSDDTAKYALFGLSNWVMQSNTDTYFAPRAEFNPFTHTWSLGVEEQYYLVAPIFVFFWLRSHHQGQTSKKKLAAGVLGMFVLLSIAYSVWNTELNPTVAFYSIVSRFWELACGALLFMLTQRPSGEVVQGKGSLHGAGAWLGLAFVTFSLIFSQASNFPWPWAALAVVGSVFIIGGDTVRPIGVVRGLLANKGMVWIGKRSYSLYLWHWPIFVIMRWTVGLDTPLHFFLAISLTFVLAILSYVLIEQKLRHNRWVEARAKWVRIVLFLAVSGLSLCLITHLFSHRDRYTLSRVVKLSADWYATGRMNYPEVGERKCSVELEDLPLAGGRETRYLPKRCSSEPRYHKKIYVMGDSHAGMLASQLEQISAEEGVAVSLFTGPGCNFIDFRAAMDAAHRTAECLTFTEQMTQYVLSSAQPGDIVILSSLRLQRYGDQWANFGISDMYDFMYGPHAQASRLAAFEDAKKWLQPLVSKQLNVVFPAPTPIFKAPPFRCSDWFNQSNPICIGQNQQTKSDLERLRQPVVSSMKDLAAIYPSIHIWDAFPILCPDDVCYTERGGRPMFFDGDHLSAYGNRVVYPSFKANLIELLR